MKLIHNCKGQALVEMALILPFLLILVIAIVEGGVILNRQLTVVNAAREGARFGAYGADADDIYAQTLLATSQMSDFTEENTIIVVTIATTNDAGNGFLEWAEKVYPPGEDARITREEILTDLWIGAGCDVGDEWLCPLAANLSLVIVDVRYDHQSVLGLPIIGALAGRIPIGSWTVMRVHGLKGE